MNNIYLYNNFMCNNRQSAAGTLTNNQLQVLITGRFGDGNLCLHKGCINYKYSTNSVDIEIIKFKKELLSDLCKAEIKTFINREYKKNIIHTLYSKVSSLITEVSIKPSLELLEERKIFLVFTSKKI